MKSRHYNISRKEFLSQISWIVSIPLLIIGGLSIKRQSNLLRNKTLKIPIDINEGISFVENIIIIKEKENVQFLASSCTHLGCKINKYENNHLICPCHGSKFEFDGTPIKGPAKKPLQNLKFEIDKSKGYYIVNTL